MPFGCCTVECRHTSIIAFQTADRCSITRFEPPQTAILLPHHTRSLLSPCFILSLFPMMCSQLSIIYVTPIIHICLRSTIIIYVVFQNHCRDFYPACYSIWKSISNIFKRPLPYRQAFIRLVHKILSFSWGRNKKYLKRILSWGAHFLSISCLMFVHKSYTHPLFLNLISCMCMAWMYVYSLYHINAGSYDMTTCAPCHIITYIHFSLLSTESIGCIYILYFPMKQCIVCTL